VIDINKDNVDMAKRQGILSLHGDAELTEQLENLNLKNAKRIICLTDSDISNVYITLSARQLNPDIDIIAKVNSPQNEIKLYRAGANHTIAPYETAGLIAALYAGQPVAFEAFFGLLTNNHPITVDAIRIVGGSDLIGQKIGDIDFKSHKLILFGIAAETENDINTEKTAYQIEDTFFNFNPPVSFTVMENDVLIVFGHKYSIAKFRENHTLLKVK
jgi:voltage-gated potassium channel